jgi:hypothetical protein
MPVNPRLAHHRGTRGLSSTVSLDSVNSTNNIKNNTINNNNNDNNSTKNITGSPLTQRNINDTNDKTDGGSITYSTDKNIIDTPTRRTLSTRATDRKQHHKLNTTVYRIFYDNGALHQGYICGFDTKEGYYKIEYQDGDIEEATKEEVYRMLKNQTRHQWQEHYQQRDSIGSMTSTAKQNQGCRLRQNFQMDSEKQ